MASVKRLSGLLLISSFVLLGEFLMIERKINKQKSSYVSEIVKSRGDEREKKPLSNAATIRNSYDNL
jgi:hypothetical protein